MDRTQIRTVFLCPFKLGQNAAETAHDIHSAFSSESTYNPTVGYEKPEYGDRFGRSLEMNNNHLRA